MKTALLAAISALCVAGCALTSKNESIVPRYFSPERLAGAARPGSKSSAEPLDLRLGRVTGASHLDERIVFRDSDYELGYYDERRWTELPEEYLRRQLGRVLFEERGVHHVVGGSAPTLEVELVAFEEIRSPKRVARVEVKAMLLDQRLVRWEETLTEDQPVSVKKESDPASATVEAIGLALSAVVNRVADHVLHELSAPPPGADEAKR